MSESGIGYHIAAFVVLGGPVIGGVAVWMFMEVQRRSKWWWRLRQEDVAEDVAAFYEHLVRCHWPDDCDSAHKFVTIHNLLGRPATEHEAKMRAAEWYTVTKRHVVETNAAWVRHRWRGLMS